MTNKTLSGSDLLHYLGTLRKDLHRIPERSGSEKETAARIYEELNATEPDEIITGLGGHGLLASYRPVSGDPKQTLLFRAELDAIAVTEETGLPYQSRRSGTMHACGHDGHMAVLIGLAHRLARKRPSNSTILLLFQPSEETGEGAAAVMSDKQFRNLKIDHGFALHNLPGYEENTIYIRYHSFASASIGLEVMLKGRFSHAASPEEGLNPSFYMCQLILDIRESLDAFVNAHQGNKMAVTYIRMGERAFGISPGEARFGVTLRSATDQGLAAAAEQFKERVNIDEPLAGSQKNQQTV